MHLSSCSAVGVLVCEEDRQKYTDDSPSHNATFQIIHLNELSKAARVVVVCRFSIAKGLRRPKIKASDRQIVLEETDKYFRQKKTPLMSGLHEC